MGYLRVLTITISLSFEQYITQHYLYTQREYCRPPIVANTYFDISRDFQTLRSRRHVQLQLILYNGQRAIPARNNCKLYNMAKVGVL